MFYENLRDNTAGSLITKFGRDATLRKQTNAYDPTTGLATNSNSDTAVKILTLPMSKARDTFSEELVATFDQFVIMSAQQTAAAGVALATNDIVLIGSEVTRVVAFTPVEPAGIAVIYKIGLARA